MKLWERVKQTVKKYLSGDSSNKSSGSSNRSSNRSSTKTSSRRSARDTSTSQYSVNDRRNVEERREAVNAYRGARKSESDEKQQARERLKEKFKASESRYKSMADSVRSDSAKEKAQERKDWHKATNHRYDVDEKGISDAERKKRRQNIKSRPYDSKTAVAEAEHAMKYHRNAESFARGALSGATFGASDLVAKYGTKGEAKKAEEVYQEKKNKTAEGAGEAAGTLASFGTTAVASKAAIKGLAPKAVRSAAGRGGEKLAARLAEKEIIRKAARKEVENAVKKGLTKEVSKEAVERVAKQKAKELVANLGEDAAINLTTGSLYSATAAAKESENRDEFRKNLIKNEAENFALGGAATVGLPAAGKAVKRALGGVSEGTENALRSLANEKAASRALARKAGLTTLEPSRVNEVRTPETPIRQNTIDDLVSENPNRQATIDDIVNGKPQKKAPPKSTTQQGEASQSSRRIEDVVNKKRQKPTNKEKLSAFTKTIRTKVSDSLAAFEDEARKKARTDHEGMLDDYGAINKVRSYGAQARRSIENQQLKWNGDRYENGKSLNAIFDGMDEKTESAFDTYLLLKHAPDRLREGKPVFDNMEGLEEFNDPEVCLREADRILKEHPDFAEKAEEVYRYTRNELQNRVDAGLLPQKVADDWNAKYPYYVPTGRDGFFNEVHNIKGSVAGAGELKAAKGSDRDIRSIREQLEDATNRNWRDMSLNNMFRRMFGDRIAADLAEEADGGLEKVLDNTMSLSHSKERGKYYADIYVDGEKKRVELEPRFFDGLKDLYKNGRLGNGIDEVNDVLSNFTQVWKNLITEWSPIFMVKNFMRDFPEAIINTRQTKEFLQSMRPALKDLLENGEYSRALRDAGISNSTFIDIDKNLAKRGKSEPLSESLKSVGRFIPDKLARGNELTEMYPRLVEYMATFKRAGVNLKDADITLRNRAAANAADVTVNFGRNGSVGKALNKGFVPFFNPSAQGWSKFVRNITELEGAKATLSFMAKATALGAAPLAISNYLYQDNPNYQMISARDKANNYIVAIPPQSEDTNVFLKIPRSRFASVYGLPLVNAFNENKMGWAEAIKIANDQVAPLDPIESNAFGAFMQTKNNKTWYGTPIVSQSLEDLPKPEQYDANTSNISIGLGKATENLPEPLQISPKKADYAIDATTGVVGDFLLPMTTKSRQSGDTGIKKVLPAAGNVVKRQFSIDSVTQNDLSTRFYDKLGEADTKNKSVHGGEKESEEYKRLNSYSTEISNINKAIKELQGGDKATKQDDIYGLQKVRNQLMQSALNGEATPSSSKTLNAVQKYVGTTYAIDNFGSKDDKDAMEVYGASMYGKLSKSEMQKKIDADKDFYKGVSAIGGLEDKLSKADLGGRSTTLAKAVALASVGASNELFGAYKATKQSRTETANKMERAQTYFADGGSEDEFVKLEKARKTLGKLSDYDKEAELKKIKQQQANGEIDAAEYWKKEGEINYNANISYVGLATSLAQANAPSRGYALYDIKARNIRKGINLAAMGFTARDYREMAKAVDSDGNGYPSKAEIAAYVSNSDVEDKATLFDALYPYPNGRNPFGAVTNYSRSQAAAKGRESGVDSISNERRELEVKDDSSGKSGRGYYRRGYRRYGYSRRSSSSDNNKPLKVESQIKTKNYKADSAKYEDAASALQVRSRRSKAKLPTTVKTEKVTPPKAKMKKYEI